MAGACRRFISVGHRRGLGHTGADRRDAAIFDDATTLDLIIDHLYGHERWLPDSCSHFRLRPADVGRTWLVKCLCVSHNYLSNAVPREHWLRGDDFSDHF